jgi:hypothetical protein
VIMIPVPRVNGNLTPSGTYNLPNPID